MKINTDGILLGTLSGQNAPASILDIGTGTGVIAMMLAQRFDQAHVDAVEIDEAAATRAEYNFIRSPFAGRLHVFHQDISLFEPSVRYDLIVSNPPYFVNDLKSQEARKGIARHADEAFFELLIRKVAIILTAEGLFWVILPVKQAADLMLNAVLYRLFAHKIIHLYSDENKEEFRQIICFGFGDRPVQHEKFYIYAGRGVYTDAYQHLLKDFFLAF
ncbi:tRNA1(Val) (adenine(37)-N6)-methyltransferase [Pedobacter sp. HMWF019]|uniref:tRNA1(Val) (adenine(37)-N6)-methyltransferase n=1 Tax=Pedobacter sp. HMWF019 TaxID=2056856 RepID=UPI001E5239E8|nr:methyltransferase [Pedobacter sp. HMWF019]